MEKRILITACAIPFLFCSTAVAEVYVSGNIGLAMLNDSDIGLFSSDGSVATLTLKSDSGLGLGFAVGYAFGNTRMEGEYAYQKNDLDKVEVSAYGYSGSGKIGGETSSHSFLYNVYYDFKNTSLFTPFLSAGVGVSNVEVDLLGASEDDTVFAYQIGAGVAYAMTDKTFMDLTYRYFGTSDPEFDGVEIDYSSHNVYLGVRVSF